MKYKSLSPSQAKLLFSIWELESSRPAQAITSTELARELKTTEGFIRKIIMEIDQLSMITRYKYFPSGVGRKGRPRSAYRLNRDNLISMPETARVLLQLTTFPLEGAYRINRAKFEQHMATSYGLNIDLVRNRIEQVIKTGYVESIDDNYIYPSPRILCEKMYLELIASEARQGDAKNKKRKERS